MTAPEGAPPQPPRLVPVLAWGFMIGSALFVVGVPLSTSDLPPAVSGWTFFAGSVFFTTAAVLQTLVARRELPDDLVRERRWNRLMNPRATDWTAAAVQFVGTLEFNVTTLASALVLTGAADASAQQVWRPDAIGSVLFLVSSAIALAPEVRHRRHTHVRNRSWTVAALNMLGSILFGVSAIGARPEGDGVRNLAWANAGTVLGALCFLGAAALLLPRRRPS
jgi:hypothetical protein